MKTHSGAWVYANSSQMMKSPRSHRHEIAQFRACTCAWQCVATAAGLCQKATDSACNRGQALVRVTKAQEETIVCAQVGVRGHTPFF